MLALTTMQFISSLVGVVRAKGAAWALGEIEGWRAAEAAEPIMSAGERKALADAEESIRKGTFGR